MTWLILKITRPNGLAALRMFAVHTDTIYVKNIARRVNIYAVKVDDPDHLLSYLSISRAKYEVIAKADSLELGDGWEKVEIVPKTFHSEFGTDVTIRFIKYKGKEYPIGRVRVGLIPAEEYENENIDEDLDEEEF